MSTNSSFNIFSKIQRKVARSIIEENYEKSILIHKRKQIAKSIIIEETQDERDKNNLNLKMALTSYVNDFKREIQDKNLPKIQSFFDKMSEVSKVEVTDEKFNRNKLIAGAEILVKFGSSLNSIAKFVKKSSIEDEKKLSEIDEFKEQKDSIKTLFKMSSTTKDIEEIITGSEYSPDEFLEEISELTKAQFLRLTSTSIPKISIPTATESNENEIDSVDKLEKYLKDNINNKEEQREFLEYTKNLKKDHPLKDQTILVFKERLEKSTATTLDKKEALEFFQKYISEKEPTEED
jgi:hypothetical protein